MEGISKNSSTSEDRVSRNSGFIQNDKMKMLDITRDKPIKVAVKVAVPVRDHPKFNFVGKLLGPKGNSMKRLQEDTMCKMAVLGRGSMKDRKKEEELRASGEPRYAHLSEDLHVEISTFAAPAEAHARIAYALAEVRRFLVPDYHDDIRQEQMWEMQVLSSSSSSSSQTQSNDPNCSPNGLSMEGLSPTSIPSSTNDTKNARVNEKMSISMDCITESSAAAAAAATASISAAVAAAAASSTTTTTSNTISTGANCSDTAATTHVNNLTNALHMDLSSAAAHAAHAHHHHHHHHPHTHSHHHHPSAAVAAAIHHQLAAAGMSIIKPATGVAAVTGLPTNQPSIGVPNEAETTATTLALLEPPSALLHPALRGVKAVNIAGSLTRKRPLLGVPRSGMNPTKRTVMTLLARAKNSQSIHNIRGPTPLGIPEPLQMITSPLILPQPMDEAMVVAQKETLTQGV